MTKHSWNGASATRLQKRAIQIPREFVLTGASVLGLLLIQLTWALCVQPFGGLDEVDHAYRAASVARGHWAPPEKSSSFGRGDLIRVPTDIVDAAALSCMDLSYTKLLNCHAASWPDRHGNALVASSAARYNPVYYWFVGFPARAFDGVAADLAMRLMNALLCDMLLGGALWITFRHSRSRWPGVGILVVLTPVVLYATANVAPNGVQMCAGVLMWTAALALSRCQFPWTNTSLVTMLGVGTLTMVTVHTTGPMWAVLMAAILMSMPSARTAVSKLWTMARRQVLCWTGVIALATAVDLVWTLARRTNRDGDDLALDGMPYGDLPVQWLLWIFQTIGAVPFRTQYLPSVVFVTTLLVFTLMCGLAWRIGGVGYRAALISIVVVFLALPTTLTYLSYDQLGFAWQGRYSLPFACGSVMAAGWVLDDQPDTFEHARVLLAVVPITFSMNQIIGVVHVAGQQDFGWPAFDLGGKGSAIALAICAALGAILLCVSLGFAKSRSRPPLSSPDILVTDSRE